MILIGFILCNTVIQSLCPVQKTTYDNISAFKKMEATHLQEQLILQTQVKKANNGLWHAISLLINSMNQLEQNEKKLRESEFYVSKIILQIFSS